jgi:hypothetical protein
MIGRLLRALQYRRSAARAARLEALRVDIDARLAARRAGRDERSARARKAASTKVHAAYAQDTLIQGQTAR